MTGQPQLECPIPGGTVLNIDMTDLQVLDPGDASNFIIDAGDPFKVSATFLVGGSAVGYFKKNGTKFRVEYYYEGFGSAPEGTLGFVDSDSSKGIDSATCAGAQEYSGAGVTELTVPASTLTPGLYKLSAVVSCPDVPMFGYVDGPLVQQI